MDPRYLATKLGLSDQPPSACLVDLMGMAGSGRLDELSILGDIGERLSFTFDFMGKFDM